MMDMHEKPMDLEDALDVLCRVHFREETFDHHSLHDTFESVPTVQMGAVPSSMNWVREHDYVQAWLSVRQHILDRRRFFEATHRLTDVTGLLDGSLVIGELVKQADVDPMVRTLLTAFQRTPQSPRNIVELALNAVLHLSMLSQDMQKTIARTLALMPTTISMPVDQPRTGEKP